MSTSVPLQVTTTTFRGRYGRATGATFTPALHGDAPVVCTEGKKSKEPTGQLFTVDFPFNGERLRRVAIKAFVANSEDRAVPAIDPDTKQPAVFFLEQWKNKDGALLGRRIEGNPEHQTVKYHDDNAEDLWRKKGFKPATVEDVIAAQDAGLKGRADYAQAKADKSVSTKNVAEMLASALRDAFKGNAEAMVAAVRQAVSSPATTGESNESNTRKK
jgi:hypothetical protein